MTRAHELCRLLYMSAEYVDPNQIRSHISGLEHALRVATMAKRYDSEPTMVFIALVHDLARPLSDIYHGEVMAEIVRDMVDEKYYHVLRTHGQYQDWLLNGTKLDSTTPWYQDGMRLASWEMASFDVDWSLRTIYLEEGIWIIQNFCGDRI